MTQEKVKKYHVWAEDTEQGNVICLGKFNSVEEIIIYNNIFNDKCKFTITHEEDIE